MKSAVIIIIVLLAVLHARFTHTRTVTRISRKEGHLSESEGSQSTPISSEAQLTRENLSGPAIPPESYKMDSLNDNGKNGDQPYVLVPLRDLMRNRRESEVEHSGENQDPLYVMFPFQEIIRKSRDFDGDLESNLTSPMKSEMPEPYSSNFKKSERRKRRGISSQDKWPLKTKRIAKRRPHTLSVRKERMSFNDLVDVDYDDTLHGEPQTKHLRTNTNHFSVEQSDKKMRTSSYLTELKSQLHPEMFDGLHQKPRILTDFSDLSPKVLQTVIGKPKKSSVNPINITMFISNLIPPNEVDNTRITNAGKLYKSGCLKFSIQLERPGACSCSPDDNGSDDLNGKSSSCQPVVTQKVACVHSAAADDKGKAVENPSSSSPGSCAAAPAASKAQSASAETADTARSNDPTALNKDVSSLLLQLIGADKKLPKKPAATSGQTILMDNEIVKELQRLFANQVASKGSEAAGKSVSATPAPGAPIAPNSPKARAIAEALNLFSKYASLKQNSM